jgi:hypothetical protein
MTSNHQIFHEINTSFETNVRMSNGTLVQVKGKVTIAVHTKMGLRFMRDVLLVPDLKYNLLSVSNLFKTFMWYIFEKNDCEIID